MCGRRTENEDHPVLDDVLCSFFLQLLCIESLQATSDSSRSDHLCGLSIEHQNSSVDIEFYEEFV